MAKALQYASEAGHPERWLDPEYYKRALLFTGAYSLRQAAASCLKGVSASERESLMREATQVWNQWRLGTKAKNWRKLGDPPLWSIISVRLPAFVVCAIDFKHRNSPRYSEKILAYRELFRSRQRPSHETAEAEMAESAPPHLKTYEEQGEYAKAEDAEYADRYDFETMTDEDDLGVETSRQADDISLENP